MNNDQPLKTQPLCGQNQPPYKSTWLIVSWMEADTYKMGNDRWSHPALINIYNWIMRLNSASSVCAEASLGYRCLCATEVRHCIGNISYNCLVGFRGVSWLSEERNAKQQSVSCVCSNSVQIDLVYCLPESAEKIWREKAECQEKFSEIPEIQFQRYECHFWMWCLEIKWTDRSKWGVCAVDCYF